MSKKDKKPVVYAFIDSQNLNLGVQSLGWKLDFKKFRLYLKNKYNVDRAYLFIGLVPGNEQLYEHLSAAGYKLVFKPTIAYDVGGKKTHKGNVDAELVLYAAAKKYRSYDKAIIVSGDGDFRCLVEYLIEKRKLLHVMTPNRSFSKLLRDYLKFIVQIDKLKGSLEYKQSKNQPVRSVETLGRTGKTSRSSGRSETLGLPKHGDKKSVANQGKNVKINQNAPQQRRALSDVKPQQFQNKLSDKNKNSIAKKTKKLQEKK